MHKIEETAEKNDKKDIDKKKSEGKIPWSFYSEIE
jgi:hypothetical protein